jgi:hypothetical protein
MAQRLNDADFQARLAGFLAAAQLKVDAYNAQFSHLANATKLRVDGNGVKYIRIVRPGSGVYVFVSRETGDILKAATFTKPVTNNPRGNISDEDYGARGVNWHGAVYLR